MSWKGKYGQLLQVHGDMLLEPVSADNEAVSMLSVSPRRHLFCNEFGPIVAEGTITGLECGYCVPASIFKSLELIGFEVSMSAEDMLFEVVSISLALPVARSAEYTKIAASMLFKFVVEPGCSVVEELAVTLGSTHCAHVGFEVAIRMSPKMFNILFSPISVITPDI